MSVLTVTAEGQITLRQDLLTHIGVSPGDKIAVQKLPDGRIEMKASPPDGDISDVFDMLKSNDGPRLSIADMNSISAKGWAQAATSNRCGKRRL
jgi:hypothetical protein